MARFTHRKKSLHGKSGKKCGARLSISAKVLDRDHSAAPTIPIKWTAVNGLWLSVIHDLKSVSWSVGTTDFFVGKTLSTPSISTAFAAPGQRQRQRRREQGNGDGNGSVSSPRRHHNLQAGRVPPEPSFVRPSILCLAPSIRREPRSFG